MSQSNDFDSALHDPSTEPHPGTDKPAGRDEPHPGTDKPAGREEPDPGTDKPAGRLEQL